MAKIEGESAASRRLAPAPGANKEGLLCGSGINWGLPDLTNRPVWPNRRGLAFHRARGEEIIKQKLLTIDDDPTVVDALETVLKAEGYDVVSAQSGEAGLKALNDMQVDLVLLDLQLPGIQGREVLQQIRDQSRLPVIIMAAACRDETRREVERLGVTAVIRKPFGPEDILWLISDALAEAEKR